MLTLALDTTTRGGSCALVRDADVLVEHVGDGTRSQAEQWPGELMTILDAGGVTLTAVDLFAVATGPGSFTGLRVGIATMQGLAFASGRPLIGVSTLEALAALAAPAAGAASFIATWVEAWRGEIYGALFEGGHEVEEVTVGLPAELLGRLQRRLAGTPGATVTFTGNAVPAAHGAIVDALGTRALFADPVAPPAAGALGRLAVSQARAGLAPSPDTIRPLYVRRPEPAPVPESRGVR